MVNFSSFLKRVLIYQLVFLIIFAILIDFDKSVNKFKNDLISLNEKINSQKLYSVAFTNFIDKNFQIIYQILVPITAVSSLLALLFNIKSCGLISAFAMSLHCFVHYNPLLVENQMNSPYGISKELILTIGVILGILVSSLNGARDDNKNKLNFV